jgi:hypothetical protein
VVRDFINQSARTAISTNQRYQKRPTTRRTMAELAEGYRLFQYRNFPGAFNHAGRNLKHNYNWPSAHFLMGKSCSMIEKCPRELALYHLRQSVEMMINHDNTGENMGAAMVEPRLSLIQQEEAYRLWLAVASQAGYEGTDEYYRVILKTLTILKMNNTSKLKSDNNAALELLYSSWIPSHSYSAQQSKNAWVKYESIMTKLIEGGDHVHHALFHVPQLRPGSINLEDPLVAAAYGLQFFHAYVHPSVSNFRLFDVHFYFHHLEKYTMFEWKHSVCFVFFIFYIF